LLVWQGFFVSSILVLTKYTLMREHKVIDYEENVADGFEDAHVISTDSRLQGTNFMSMDSAGSSSSMDSTTDKVVDDVNVGDGIQWKDLDIGQLIGQGIALMKSPVG